MCRMGVKYQYTIQAVCAYAYVFWKRPGCALIGACAPIRTNMVVPQIMCFLHSQGQIQ